MSEYIDKVEKELDKEYDDHWDSSCSAFVFFNRFNNKKFFSNFLYKALIEQEERIRLSEDEIDLYLCQENRKRLRESIQMNTKYLPMSMREIAKAIIALQKEG